MPPKDDTAIGYFLLVQAQILRETLSHFDQMKSLIDPDYVRYLQNGEVTKIRNFQNLEEIEDYLRDSRRMTFKDWITSLNWNHVTMGI